MAQKQRLRRTMMFVPGNNPGMMRDAHIYGSDSIMFDLEDSVSMAEKDAARQLVYNALKTIDYGNTEIVVRINPIDTPYGRADVEAMVAAGAHVLRMPKTESAKDITDCEAVIEEMEKKHGRPVGDTLMMAAIEGAMGVINAYQIATASQRLIGIALGAEDFCANMKCQRTATGAELQLARQTIVMAARAAGIDALDTVYSDVNNEEQLVYEAQLIKDLGFDGKSVINPRQIAPVHKVFNPTAKDIEKAKRIVAAIKEAEAKGSGVISLNGKMVDKPVVIRAQRVIELALVSGIITPSEVE
ncbi:MAG: citrate (pro-3S)-lyase subunit beta [Clostridiaceae bacterium]|nr:citrate (pro-3S)-lyase subunit beta [Clostridiaceae bacterium]